MDECKAQFSKDNFGHNLWLDIVNSEHYDGFGNLTDHLNDPAWLSCFLEHYHFDHLPTNAPPQLIEFRAWLRHIAQLLDKNSPLSGIDLAILNRYLAQSGVRALDFSAESQTYRLTFQPLHPDWQWVQAEAAASLATILTTQQQKRIKICANSNCNWVFFDKTKGNNRCWCNDLTCGNRARVRRYRSQQKNVTDAK